MKYLLDTHALLWIVEGDARLSPLARALYQDRGNQMHLSLASLWEIAIKVCSGKLDIGDPLAIFIEQQVLRNAIAILHIETWHIVPLESLPLHHRDPLDRVIISQAMCEDMPIISNDSVFDLYPITRIW